MSSDWLDRAKERAFKQCTQCLKTRLKIAWFAWGTASLGGTEGCNASQRMDNGSFSLAVSMSLAQKVHSAVLQISGSSHFESQLRCHICRKPSQTIQLSYLGILV
jgi:hypothetical protein